MKLKNKVAIVTGAATGIGKAIAVALAREGANVVINFHIQRATETLNEITALGCSGIAIKADISNIIEVEDMVEKVLKSFGRVDILVNNAAIVSSTPLEDITDEEWNNVMSVNLKGVFNCIRAVAKYMKKQKYGKIINISSSSAITGGTTAAVGPHYVASKAGIIGLTKSLAKGLSSYGININVIAPGLIETEMFQKSNHIGRSVLQLIPLGRLGRPEDVAEVAVFLASDNANYITGETLLVDGGLVMGRTN